MNKQYIYINHDAVNRNLQRGPASQAPSVVVVTVSGDQITEILHVHNVIAKGSFELIKEGPLFQHLGRDKQMVFFVEGELEINPGVGAPEVAPEVTTDAPAKTIAKPKNRPTINKDPT